MLERTALAVAICSTAIFAQTASIPTADVKGSKDSPVMKRYDGSFIVAYDRKDLDEFTLPLSCGSRIANCRAEPVVVQRCARSEIYPTLTRA